MRVTLTITAKGSLPVDARLIQPASVLGLSRMEIEKLPLSIGNRSLLLGEICSVISDTQEEDMLIMEGETHRLTYAGFGMNGGKLIISGDVGDSVGSGMHAGEIDVLGSAGDCLGDGMQGGLIHVHGNVGDGCGGNRSGLANGMCGGMILVDQDGGREAGAGMRRGLIYISGDSGEYPGARMLAGSIFVAGKAGRGAGLGMKRGSIIAGELEQILPGFNSTGYADDEWVRIYFKLLKEQGIAVPADWLRDGFHRFSGDHLELGKGELLVHDFIE
jgi:formylmethanofuran dehydrogenase subunit C